MNAGKICVSLCYKTANELFSQIDRVKPNADIIELRLDFLDAGEVSKVVGLVKNDREGNSKMLLATLRSNDQGGHRPLTPEERAEFWFNDREQPFWGGDFEEDVVEEAANWPWPNRIASYHDFSGRRYDLETVFDRLNKTSATHLKIAIHSEDITDAIRVWNLLKKAASENKPFIPVAMGEAGKWTRILGLAHGAFMTYASAHVGAEAAPGQISLADMVDVFRVKELDRDTEIFGVIAGDTSYSISPWMQNAAFKAAGMNRAFIPLQTSDLDEFIRRMVRTEAREVELNFRGFSVTNPYKQSIMKYLDEIEETALKIEAVNTVKINGSKLYGYNTDARGFIQPLKTRRGDLRGAGAAVVGAGGAARACVYALKEEGADVTLFARDPKKAFWVGEEFDIAVKAILQPTESYSADILVNTTPLGTKGDNENSTVATADQLKNVGLVYDLIYNPADTLLMREASKAGITAIGGLEMLVAQGVKQFEIWTGEAASTEEMINAVRKKLDL